MTLIAAADGSALGNPGPAGWAWYVDDDCWASGGWAYGTNNMGELTAVLDLLEQTADVDDLLVFCDSTYTINSITKWMPGWKRKGWKKGDGKPVANVEIMKMLDHAMQGRQVRFEWVKGHTGHELNEAADRLANAAALAFQSGGEPDPGPGYAGSEPGAHDFVVTAPPEPEEFRRVVLHEFGHALGFHHEHQNPVAACEDEFDWDHIYTYLGGPPNNWPKEQVDSNMRRLDQSGLVADQFDRDSIMLYTFPPDYFKSGQESPCFAPYTTALAPGDRHMMEQM